MIISPQSLDTNLSQLLAEVKSGSMQLPEFQRDWTWDDSRIRGIIASLSQGYPMGAIMRLQYGNPDIQFKYRTITGVKGVSVKPEHLILDGQQRLTSIYQATSSKEPVLTKTEKGKAIKRYYYLSMEKCLDDDEDRFDAVLSIPEKASKTAFVYAIDKYLKDNNKYQKGEARIAWQDIEDCIILVSNNFSTQTSYENQTKKAITNKFVQEAMTDFLKSRLETYFIENRVDALKIAEQVLINKRSRESAEKQRLNIKKKLSGSIDISNRVEKFVDCRTRDVSRREIYIVEGDSALGSVKLSRDGEFQGIMPVRGKILNCLKADYPRIFKSEIITDLLKVLGCGVEVPGKFVKDLNAFDINNLRWNKVILCTDADVDGFQIRTLILTMIYRLCPTLIREGYVYIAETPLFEITCGEKTWFAYTDKEKNDIVKTLEGKRYKVDRSKGLGQNDPEMMWLTTMNPETRRLIKVMPEDAEATAHSFDLLLGDNLQGRKDHIAENGYKYLEMIDVS